MSFLRVNPGPNFPLPKTWEEVYDEREELHRGEDAGSKEQAHHSTYISWTWSLSTSLVDGDKLTEVIVDKLIHS